MYQVNTYASYSEGLTCSKSKRENLERWGFEESIFTIDPENGKPLHQARNYMSKYVKEMEGTFLAVTVPRKDALGWSYYELWIKKF